MSKLQLTIQHWQLLVNVVGIYCLRYIFLSKQQVDFVSPHFENNAYTTRTTDNEAPEKNKQS